MGYTPNRDINTHTQEGSRRYIDITNWWAILQTEILITYSRGQLKVHRDYSLVGYTLNRDINNILKRAAEGTYYIDIVPWWATLQTEISILI